MKSGNYQSLISQGWVGMLFLLMTMMLTDLTECGMKGDLSPLQSDPGMRGLWFIVIVASANVIIQVSLKTFDGIPFRWFVFIASFVYALVFIGHQVTHLFLGEGLGMHFVLDSVHHIIGVWSTIAAFRWARNHAD